MLNSLSTQIMMTMARLQREVGWHTCFKFW